MDSDVSGLVARGHGAAESGPCGNSNECPNILRVSSLNVGTLKRKGDEMMEMLSRRRLDFCCVQETRWKTLVKMIDGKNLMYKYFGSGLGNKFGGVGILLSEKWWENVYEVTRISDRIIAIRLVIGKKVFAIICIYAPQSNLSESNKDEFYHSLQGALAKITHTQEVLICGDFNRHIGASAAGYGEVHGGLAFGKRNADSERVLEFSVTNNLLVANSWFKKRSENLVTYQAGLYSTQIDCMLCRRRLLKYVTNVKVILGEECAFQHKLVVAVLRIPPIKKVKKQFEPRIKVWKLLNPDVKAQFSAKFTSLANQKGPAKKSVNNNWLFLKKNLLSTSKHVCGVSSKVPWKRQTWGRNSEVDAAVTEKRKFFKLWKVGGSRDAYVSAKRASNRIVYHAKNEALKCHLQKNKADFTNIFRLAKQIRHNNQDFVGEKPLLNDTGTLSLDDSAKKAAWREYYVRLLNHEFAWDENNLSDVLPVKGPSHPITNDMVRKAVCKMIPGKAADPSGVVSEMIKASGGAGIELIRDLINAIIAQNCIPSDWQYSYIVNL